MPSINSGRPSAVRLVDVAAAAGVSRMTVSRAVRNPESVAPETRERVRQAIASLGWVPNRIAGGLASKRTGIIGVIVPTVMHSLFADTLGGLGEVLAPRGYQLLVGDAHYTLAEEETLIATFLGHRPEALVLTSLEHTPAARTVLGNAGIPVVETWDLAATPLDMVVGFSNRGAAEAMTRLLAESGRRLIGFVMRRNPLPGDRTAPRLAGWRGQLASLGLPPGPVLEIEDPLSITRSGSQIADFIAANSQMDALLCVNELIAVGAVLECGRRGIDVPGRVAIAGFGDTEIASAIRPALTTVRVPGRAMGRGAGELLVQRLAGKATKSTVDVGFSLVRRDSA